MLGRQKYHQQSRPARGLLRSYLEPGKQTFDLPASAEAPKFASVLGFGPAAVGRVGRDQLDAVLLFETRIQGIAVVGSVAEELFSHLLVSHAGHPS